MRCPPTNTIPAGPTLHEHDSWHLERRADGAVLVRVPSRVVDGSALPEAVFAFRAGDPQFAYWDQRLRARSVVPPTSLPMPIVDVDQSVG